MYKLAIISFLISCAQNPSRGEVVDGKFNDLTVVIDNDLNVATYQRLNFITKLEDLLTEASIALFTATSEKLYLGNVYIIVPPDWSDVDATDIGFLGLEPHIQVSNNGLGGQAPYTLQGGVCGAPGLKMSVPLQFLTSETLQSKYGDPGKILANEFLKLMYGVYDEFGYPGDPFAPYSFYDLNEDSTRVTSCTEYENLEGKWKDESGDVCTADENDPDCRMEITGSSANFSTLFVTHLDNINLVCENDTHDYVAPTIHNKLCGISVMSVLMQHQDFQGEKAGVLGPIFPTDPTPAFSRIRMSYLSTFILIDQNGGDIMDEVFEIHDQVKLAIEILLQSKNIKKLGLGLFNEDSVTYLDETNPLKPIQDINLQDVLDFFPTSLSNTDESAPSYALSLVVDKIVEDSLVKTDVNIIVIQIQKTKRRDEEDAPNLSSEKDTFYVSQVLYKGEDNDDDLEDIENYLTGKLYVDYRYEPTVASSVILSLTSDVERIILLSEVATTGESSAYEKEVFVDSTIGINTIFAVNWKESKEGNVVLQNPSGEEVDPTDQDPDIFVVNDAQEGFWSVILTPGDSNEAEATIRVTTQARDVDQIEMKLWSSAVEEQHDLAASPLVLYASLRVGPNPITGAYVSAHLYTLDAVNMSVVIPLGDNGAGTPDLTLGDGVYSCYLNHIDEFGVDSDNLTIFADLLVVPPKAKDSFRTHNSFAGVPVQSRAMTVDPFFDDPMPDAIEMRFERTMFNALSFKVTGAKNYDPPPSAIVDFRLMQIEGGTEPDDKLEVVLIWTAPGEDFNEGEVTSYELRYTDTADNLEDFESWTEVSDSEISDGSLVPSESGMEQTVTLTFEKSPVTIFLAIRALDKAKNKGGLSPRVSINGNYTGLYIPATMPPPSGVTDYTTPYPNDDFVGSAAFIILIIFCVIIVVVGVGVIAYVLMKDDDLISKFKKTRKNSSLGAHHTHMAV